MNPHSPEAQDARELSRQQRRALCEQLDLDPERTIAVTVEFEAGFAMTRWQGARRLTPDEVTALLGAIAKAGGAG